MEDPELHNSIQRLEEAMFFAMDRARRGVTLRRENWVQLTCKDAKTHYRNGVFFSVLEAHECQTKIDEVKAHYDDLGTPFRWIVGPSTQPANMMELLRSSGFKHFETQWGMVGEPRMHALREAHRDVSVGLIDASSLEDLLSVKVRGWAMPDRAADWFRGEISEHLGDPNTDTYYFLAKLGGLAVGEASLCLIEDFAHFSGSVVLPEFRRRGVYGELLRERMKFVADRGIKAVTNHCVSTTSGPIAKRAGLKQVCDFHIFIHGDK